jgi:hypothetical protein
MLDHMVDVEFAEAGAERRQLLRRKLLPPENDHTPVMKNVEHFRKCRIRQRLRHIHTADFGAEPGRQRIAGDRFGRIHFRMMCRRGHHILQ